MLVKDINLGIPDRLADGNQRHIVIEHAVAGKRIFDRVSALG